MWHRRPNRGAGIWVGAALGALTMMPMISADAQEAGDERRVSFGGGADVYNKYFFRGVLQEDDGLIVQPWAELNFNLFESDDDALGGIDLSVGTWNSFHSEQTGAAGAGPGAWYESDFYSSLGANVFDTVDLGLTYTAYMSPNGAFGTIEELALGASYDDSAWWDDAFALNPYIVAAKEIDGSYNAYMEVGVEPGFKLVADGHDIAIDFPVTVGLSLDDYYVTAAGDEEFYGYTQAGVTATMPLAFIAPEYGAWELGAGAHYLHLGQAAREANGGDNHEFIASIGLSMGF